MATEEASIQEEEAGQCPVCAEGAELTEKVACEATPTDEPAVPAEEAEEETVPIKEPEEITEVTEAAEAAEAEPSGGEESPEPSVAESTSPNESFR